jgi:hypothetical protein
MDGEELLFRYARLVILYSYIDIDLRVIVIIQVERCPPLIFLCAYSQFCGDGSRADLILLSGSFWQAYFQSDLTLVRSWYINGNNYSRTLEDWLKRQDRNKYAGLQELERDAEKKGHGKAEGMKAFYRFRVFYIACSELFRMNNGEEYASYTAFVISR